MTATERASGEVSASDQAPPRRRRRGLRWTLAILAVLLLALAGYLAWSVLEARSAAADLEAGGAAAQRALDARDEDALRASAADAQDAAERFARATAGPVWWAAARLPWIGDQVRPVVVAGQVMDDVADGVLAPLATVDRLDVLTGGLVTGGGIDPDVLTPYADTLAGADAVLTDAQERLAEVDATLAVAPVAEAYAELTARVDELGGIVGAGHLAAQLLPTMLGGEGARQYLLVVQNNAEPRSTGGIPGAFIALTVDDGAMTLGDYAASADLLVDAPVIALTADEENVYTSRMALYPQDANFTPDFPRAAQAMVGFWSATMPGHVDGVIAIDPVALGYLLADAPPTDVDGTVIGSENVARVLLRDAYDLFPSAADQDAFFARAAGALASTLFEGGGRPVQGLARAVSEGRLLVWSAHPDEQDLLEQAAIAGDFMGRADAAGLFLNDGSGSKIGYYVDQDVQVSDVMCGDAWASEQITVTLTHTFDGDPADLPDHVSGAGVYVPPAEFQANLSLYPPAGAVVSAITHDGVTASAAMNDHDGRRMTALRIELDPGESTTVTYRLDATEEGLDAPALALTPGPRNADVTRDARDLAQPCVAVAP